MHQRGQLHLQVSVPAGRDGEDVRDHPAVHQQPLPEWRPMQQPQLQLLLRVRTRLLRLQLPGLLSVHERAVLQQRDLHHAGQLLQLQLSVPVLRPSLRGLQSLRDLPLSEQWSVHQRRAGLPLSVSCRFHR